jgi:hypothetical protein
MIEPVRKFDTGATRSDDTDRYDLEGFISPIALERYCEYMQKHRKQPDGSIRASDNWQKGMPIDSYMKGMARHFLHLWTRHRGHMVRDQKAAESRQEDLCALLFNVQGYLHTLLADAHRIVPCREVEDEAQALTFGPLHVMDKPDQAIWIPHIGGARPVDVETIVRVKFRSGNGAESARAYFASDIRWEHHNSGGDIIAYRVVK